MVKGLEGKLGEELLRCLGLLRPGGSGGAGTDLPSLVARESTQETA